MLYSEGGKFIFQLRRDKIHDQALGYGRIIDQTYDETGIYAQDDWKISKKFSLLSGLRLNTHTALNHLILTPRLSLLVNLTKKITWRTTFSTGFRAPQVFDEDLHITQVGGVGMMIVNSPDLKEESSYSFTTGFDYGRQYERYNLQFSLEGFYTRLANTFILHEISGTENTRLMERINGSGARKQGGKQGTQSIFPIFSLSSQCFRGQQLVVKVTERLEKAPLKGRIIRKYRLCPLFSEVPGVAELEEEGAVGLS